MSRVVKTAYGCVAGVESGIQKITVFRGVPYARPPVGELRWRAPEEPEKWEGVLDCARFKCASVQAEHKKGTFYEIEFFQGGMEVSEDCLYLNIWADLEIKDQPVMVWYHGGAYTGGFAHEIEFDGDAIAKRGAILVTVGYRLGVLGYMAHPELTQRDGHSGNYGLMDQIAALKWVKENISAFGGDPENITIFGQSAGGGSVQCIMTSPLAKGLFNRAIIQSAGSPLRSLGGFYELDAAEKNGVALAEYAGCGLDEMYKKDAAELCRLGREFTSGGGLRFRPCMDGHALTDDPGGAFVRGAAADISFMLGSVTGDAGAFGITGEGNKDEIAMAGPVSLAKSRIRLGKPGCYVYHFDRDMPGDDHPGAFHSSELWYVFGTLMRCHRPFTGHDYELSLKMTDWWVNFARTGEPGGGWTAYTAEDPSVNVVGEGVAMVNVSESPLTDKISDDIITELYG